MQELKCALCHSITIICKHIRGVLSTWVLSTNVPTRLIRVPCFGGVDHSNHMHYPGLLSRSSIGCACDIVYLV